jgi:hypothetical protein
MAPTCQVSEPMGEKEVGAPLRWGSDDMTVVVLYLKALALPKA